MNKDDSDNFQSIDKHIISSNKQPEPAKSKQFEINQAPRQLNRVATNQKKSTNQMVQGSVLEIIHKQPEFRKRNSTPQTNQFMEILDEIHYVNDSHKQYQEKKQPISTFQRSLVDQDLLSMKQIDQEDNIVLQSPVQTAQYSGAGQQKMLIMQIDWNINSDVIQRSLQSRGNWFPRQNEERIHFNWVERRQQIHFRKLVDQGKELVNHFEFEDELLDKLKLYQNVSKYCEMKHISVDDFMLRQFNFDFESPSIKNNLANFNCLLKKSQQKQWESCTQKELEIQFSQKLKETSEWKKLQNFVGNCWILKISNLSGGMGVKIFDNYIDCRDMMRQYLKGKYEYINEFIYNENGEIQQQKYECQLVSNQFILQQYLLQPLLYNEKKFQILAFCLINHVQETYICNQLMIQIGQEKYNENNIENRETHIIQQSDQFQLLDSIDDLPLNIQETYSQIKNIAGVVCNSVSDLLNKENRTYSMQLFTFKFICDTSHKIYLIDVNQKVFLKSKLDMKFNELIPKIIDEGLQLSVDQLYQQIGAINMKYWESIS